MTAASQKIAVVGLGYVGLPLALAFGRHRDTLGFDVDQRKIDAYRQGHDPTGESPAQAFADARHIEFSSNPEDLRSADIIIVAVPTPINEARQPDLTPMIRASETVGRNLRPGCIVIYESTVYPGVTEEICGPILERESGLSRSDFRLGYSPERINPGDHEHTLEKIVKVVSGEDEETLETVAQLYESVVHAGVHRAQSIRVAEAAKVIENTQRDLNIALMNELAIIFNMLDLDTSAILAAAGTKWNFLPFKPGLVGGHCIGVDPYYLTHKAESLGYHPDVILAGRRINDGMGKFIAEQTIKKMVQGGAAVKGARVVILGITFKENCADFRNTRVVDVIEELKHYNVEILICDPRVDAEQVHEEYGLSLTALEDISDAEAIVAAVAHREFLALPADRLAALCRSDNTPFMDVKAAFDQQALTDAGFEVWRL